MNAALMLILLFPGDDGDLGRGVVEAAQSYAPGAESAQSYAPGAESAQLGE